MSWLSSAFKKAGRYGFNPINYVASKSGLGWDQTFDYVTGKGQSEDALEAARVANDANAAVAQRNIDLQREFAQMGIQWRVKDAVAAGIHPLAAIGASGASFSPVHQMVDPLPSAKQWKHNLGQNVGRFLLGQLDPATRVLSALTIERQGLENDLLKLQIKNYALNSAVGGSADPHLSGQGDVAKGMATVIDEPLKRVVSDPMDPSKEAGAIQDWQIVRTQKGYAVVPGSGVKQAIEDSPMEYQWLVRAAKRTYPYPGGGTGYMNPATGELIRHKTPHGGGEFFKNWMSDRWSAAKWRFKNSWRPRWAK